MAFNLAALGDMYIPGLAKQEALNNIQDREYKLRALDQEYANNEAIMVQRKAENKNKFLDLFSKIDARVQQDWVKAGLNPFGDPDEAMKFMHDKVAEVQKLGGNPATLLAPQTPINAPVDAPTSPVAQVPASTPTPAPEAPVVNNFANTQHRAASPAMMAGSNGESMPRAIEPQAVPPVVARATKPPVPGTPKLASLAGILNKESQMAKAAAEFEPFNLEKNLGKAVPQLKGYIDSAELDRAAADKARADAIAELQNAQDELAATKNETFTFGVMPDATDAERRRQNISVAEAKIRDAKIKLQTADNTKQQAEKSKQMFTMLRDVIAANGNLDVFKALYPEMAPVVDAFNKDTILSPNSRTGLAAKNMQIQYSKDGNTMRILNSMGDVIVDENKIEAETRRLAQTDKALELRKASAHKSGRSGKDYSLKPQQQLTLLDRARGDFQAVADSYDDKMAAATKVLGTQLLPEQLVGKRKAYYDSLLAEKNKALKQVGLIEKSMNTVSTANGGPKLYVGGSSFTVNSGVPGTTGSGSSKGVNLVAQAKNLITLAKKNPSEVNMAAMYAFRKAHPTEYKAAISNNTTTPYKPAKPTGTRWDKFSQ